MSALEAVLLLYALIMSVSATISFMLWRVLRIQLLRKLSVIWLCIILCAVAQGLWKGGPLGIVLAGALSYPSYYLMAGLVADLARLEFRRKHAHVFFALCMLCVLILYSLDFAFTAMAIPMTMSIAFPLLRTGISALTSPFATFSVKALACINIVSALHTLDFPFLRMVESFAPIGFVIGTVIVFSFAILAPLTIIEHQRDEFTSLASHELKAPLTSLQLAASLLEQESTRKELRDTPLAARLKRFSRTTERQVQHLKRLADNLLCVTHMRAGLFKLYLEEDVDLNALVSDVVERLESNLYESETSEVSQRILFKSVAHPSGGVLGRWDRFKIDLVLTNLIANAIKYGAHKPIQVEVRHDQNGATLVVRDEGIGIDDASQKRLFRPYQRASNAKGYGGMGLGLYVSRQIVKMHGGELSLKSSVGQGAAFSFTLPLRVPFNDDQQTRESLA